MAAMMRDFGGQLRGERHRRRVRRRRVLAVGLLGLALGTTIVLPPRPILVWNASASAPVGLYGVDAGAAVALGDIVIARAPEPFRSFAARRHYLPANVPLVKRVVAVAGDSVCAPGRIVRVNGRSAAARRSFDGQGRALPWWRGCRTLRDGELFLLMDHPDSFDGRYFGPVARGAVIGRARPLWTR
ncbi:S26 family signal peptidase [Novosphingobium mathurense]|uniref:Conjugative transfer signal peptidase TraF n=1 Tax=Novosphingobium mathurense TaxID=428990 RepID=A0A1U6ILA4_9SPHN|nr:S26 family signal peptidase [Novosphingobium mathurense]SLK08786.1 conjugative transfer signal peptidase TraF [Novosphingobium mathurense]